MNMQFCRGLPGCKTKRISGISWDEAVPKGPAARVRCRTPLSSRDTAVISRPGERLKGGVTPQAGVSAASEWFPLAGILDRLPPGQ